MSKYDGINIQWPISELILSGEKVIETRTYKIPDHYLNQEILMIETPGPNGKFKSRIVAIIKFTECFQYKNKTDFYKDSKKHCVDKNSPWAWTDKPKWGWKVEIIKKLSPPIKCNIRGITFRKGIEI
ncbi:hypothetical protein [Halobacteriovorax sp.]|uniref:hypothetical protein n=1 Tax=Halobacteriovorax sp. TaxID=2020862 RepID=UPI003AF1FBAE